MCYLSIYAISSSPFSLLGVDQSQGYVEVSPFYYHFRHFPQPHKLLSTFFFKIICHNFTALFMTIRYVNGISAALSSSVPAIGALLSPLYYQFFLDKVSVFLCGG